MKRITIRTVLVVSMHLCTLAPSLASPGGILYFDTGLPDNPYPSIWGTHTATFTPLHDMIIDSALGTNTATGGGRVVSIEFFLDGVLIGQGTGGGFHVPASFTQPLTLHGGVNYGMQVETFSYLQLFHVPQISTVDAIVSDIRFVDVNGTHWTAFPALQLFGPVPEPAASLLFAAGIIAFICSRRRLLTAPKAD